MQRSNKNLRLNDNILLTLYRLMKKSIVMKSKLLSDKLYYLRVIQRIAQKDLAIAIGVDAPTYSRIEKGERKAKLEQLPILAEKLKIDYLELHALWLADKLAEVLAKSSKQEAMTAIRIIQEKYSKVS